MIEKEFHADTNTLVVNFNNPYDPVQDTIAVTEELSNRLADNDEVLHYISDLTHIEVSFSDLVQGLAQAFTTPGSVFANPRLRMYTALGNSEMVKLGATAASQQDQYGKVPMRVYTTVDEALADIHN